MCYYSDHCVQSMFIHKLYTLILFLHYNCNIYLVVQFIVQIRHLNIILEKGDKPIIIIMTIGERKPLLQGVHHGVIQPLL